MLQQAHTDCRSQPGAWIFGKAQRDELPYMPAYVVTAHSKLYIGIATVVANNAALIIEQAGEWIFCHLIAKIVTHAQPEKPVAFICNEFCPGAYAEVVAEAFAKVAARRMVAVSEVNEDTIAPVEVKLPVFLSGRQQGQQQKEPKVRTHKVE